MDPGTLAHTYQALVADGQLDPDPAQRRVVQALDALVQALEGRRLARKSSALGWLFSRQAAKPEAPKGLYIHGGVGRGKTMLMDLFFASLNVRRKRRAHFHDFMADVHGRIHAHRMGLKAGTVKGDDPIPPLAAALVAEAWVLCFDEFSVTDIADAMLLGRLFSAMWAEGAVVVATSNVEPQRLYENGLNRALFLPFIAALEQHMTVLKLEARTDYRMEKMAGAAVYHVPDDQAAREALTEAWKRLTGNAPRRPAQIAVKTRHFTVAAAARGVAMASFGELCGQPLGASDYMTLARQFHTLILAGVPVLDAARRNEAKRLITLIDVLYDHHVKLVASAAAEPEGLYQSSEGTEAFEFRRTISRLMEMRSEEYLSQPHGRVGRLAGEEISGVVDT
jgi:cell division protein ZapE